MTIRKTPLVEGEYYHIYNRGNSKQKIFLDEEDYSHFLNCIFVFNTSKSIKIRDEIHHFKINCFDFQREELLVSIGAWVLMPNHFHLYITINPHKTDLCGMEEENKNNISRYMRKVLTAYVKYFNLKYSRTGGLFEGRFKSVHVKNERQAKYLFSYIHLNPIKIIDSKWKQKGMKNKKASLEFLDKYKWSSYLDFKGVKRKENKILNIKDFPRYFYSIKDFNNEILGWFKYKDE